MKGIYVLYKVGIGVNLKYKVARVSNLKFGYVDGYNNPLKAYTTNYSDDGNDSLNVESTDVLLVTLDLKDIEVFLNERNISTNILSKYTDIMTNKQIFKFLSHCGAVIIDKAVYLELKEVKVIYFWIHSNKKKEVEFMIKNYINNYNDGYFSIDNIMYRIIYNNMTPIDFSEVSCILNEVAFFVASDFQTKLYNTLCNNGKDLKFTTNNIKEFYNNIYFGKLSDTECSLLRYVNDKDIASLESKNIIDYLKKMYVTYADNNALSDFIKYIIEELLVADSEFVPEFDNAIYIYPKEFQDIANASSKRYWQIKLTGLKSIRISHRNISLKIIVYDDRVNTTHIDLPDLYSYKYNVYLNNVEITIEKNI